MSQASVGRQLLTAGMDRWERRRSREKLTFKEREGRKGVNNGAQRGTSENLMAQEEEEEPPSLIYCKASSYTQKRGHVWWGWAHSHCSVCIQNPHPCVHTPVRRIKEGLKPTNSEVMCWSPPVPEGWLYLLTAQKCLHNPGCVAVAVSSPGLRH